MFISTKNKQNNSRDKNTMLTLWKTIVLPTIEYCSVLWSPSKTGQIQNIENMQWSFIRKIKGTSGSSYGEALKKLNMYSLQRRRERYIIIYVWKILENLVPNINDSVSCYYHPRHGRKCDIKSLTQRSKYNTIKDQQITVLGVKLFNIIPKSTRDMRDVNVDAFKKSLGLIFGQNP